MSIEPETLYTSPIEPHLYNHALDACGIGMLLALRPHEATRIAKRKDAA